MTVKNDNERLEREARWEINRLLRARDSQFELMELSDEDVILMLQDYAFGEKMPDSKLYRIARDFLKGLKNGYGPCEKYLIRRCS